MNAALDAIEELERRVDQLELVVRAIVCDGPIGADEHGRLVAVQKVDPSVAGPQKPLSHDRVGI